MMFIRYPHRSSCPYLPLGYPSIRSMYMTSCHTRYHIHPILESYIFWLKDIPRVFFSHPQPPSTSRWSFPWTGIYEITTRRTRWTSPRNYSVGLLIPLYHFLVTEVKGFSFRVRSSSGLLRPWVAGIHAVSIIPHTHQRQQFLPSLQGQGCEDPI